MKYKNKSKHKSLGRTIAHAMVPILLFIPIIFTILFQNVLEARNIVYKYLEDTARIKIEQLGAGIIKMNYEMVSLSAQDKEMELLPANLEPQDASYYPSLFRMMERNRNLKVRYLEALSFYTYHETSDTLIGDQGIYFKNSQTTGIMSELKQALKQDSGNKEYGPKWNYLSVKEEFYLYSSYGDKNKIFGCVIRLDDFLSAVYVNSLGYEGIPFILKDDETIITQTKFQEKYSYNQVLNNPSYEVIKFDFTGIKNMTIYLLITRDGSVLDKIFGLQIALVIAAVALVLGCITGIFFYYKRILLPMNKFVSGLKNMGEEQFIHDSDTNNILELEMASKEFRGLLRKIKNLRIEVYEKELARQKIELEYVQEQIKPHFYLNCLNLIKTMAVSHGEQDIIDMAEMLSGCMRYVIKDSLETRRFEDEIAFIQNYVKIQKLRYGNEAFSFEVIMEDNIEEMKIPALFLQTFVENAITHGVTLDKKIEITLYSVIEKIEGQDRIYICISDTGKGFSEKTLDDIINNRSIVYADRQHIGIQNAIKRLSIIYGKKASIKLSNMEKEGGAVVEIIIPAASDSQPLHEFGYTWGK